MTKNKQPHSNKHQDTQSNQAKVSGGQQSCASAGEIVTMASHKRAGRKFLAICIARGEAQAKAIPLSQGSAMAHIDMSYSLLSRTHFRGCTTTTTAWLADRHTSLTPKVSPIEKLTISNSTDIRLCRFPEQAFTETVT